MKLKTPNFPRKGHHTNGAGSSPMVTPGPAPAFPSPQPPPHGGAPGGAPPAQPLALRKVTAGLAAPVRQRNAAVIFAGIAFIVIAGALAASVASSFDDSIEVLVASEAIEEGQPISEDHFRTVRVAAAAGDIQAVAPDSIDDLVGRIASGPIGEGAMIHPSQFADPLAETRIIVGAELEANRYPASNLKPGDTVRLISVDPRADREDEFSSGDEVATGEITDIAVVRSNRQHFSIRVSESSANVIAQLVAQDRLVLALVDQSVQVDTVNPLIPASPVVPLDIEDESGE